MYMHIIFGGKFLWLMVFLSLAGKLLRFHNQSINLWVRKKFIGQPFQSEKIQLQSYCKRFCTFITAYTVGLHFSLLNSLLKYFSFF